MTKLNQKQYLAVAGSFNHRSLLDLAQGKTAERAVESTSSPQLQPFHFAHIFPYGTALFVNVDLASEYKHPTEHNDMDGQLTKT